MKERIRKLANEARIEVGQRIGYNDRDRDNAFEEVFAELIVNKCANIVWDEAEKTSNSDVNDAGYKIIEHFFGVEE